MPRDSRVYLEDVLDAAAKIRSYVAGFDFESFGEDGKTRRSSSFPRSYVPDIRKSSGRRSRVCGIS
jgi:hypothetical protein